MPDNEVLARLYAECFDYRWYQDHYGAKYRDCCQRVVEYKSWLGTRVLDFGGGVGYLSRALSAGGYESITYDPFCRQGDAVSSGWDTVIALHMLEHANDPDRSVAEMKGLLAPGGKLIVAVPNAAGKGYSELGMGWVWAQPPLLHIFHFTAAGLVRLLERHGFVVEKISFAERWDANTQADLVDVARFRYLDSLWGRQPFNRYSIYRKTCAAITSTLRYRALAKVMSKLSVDDSELSELQVIARLGV